MLFKTRPTSARRDTQAPAVTESVVIDDKGTPAIPVGNGASGHAWSEGVDDNAQLGVQKAQATTLTWTRAALYTTLSWYVKSSRA
jgi:hypothetical protein